MGRRTWSVMVWAASALFLDVGCAGSRPATPPADGSIRRVLLPSVQVVVQKNGERIRSSSGVVIAARPGTDGVDCFVLSTGHTFSNLSDDPGNEIYVLFDRDRGPGVRARAIILATADTAKYDLALLRVRTDHCFAARLGGSPALGDPIWVVGFPWGRNMRLAGGIVSQIALDRGVEFPSAPLMVDASVAYGDSGGGVFDARSGQLLGLVEGYGTARVTLGEKSSSLYIDVPVPGETYVTSLAIIEGFLGEAGYVDLLQIRALQR